MLQRYIYRIQTFRACETQMNDPENLAVRFPGDFVSGVATAALQIEDTAKMDGCKPSIWDAFSYMRGLRL